jgi:transposase-like protein
MKCTKTRGKKGEKHENPADPPRRRGNKKRGHGTWESDRPPVSGVVGRDSGQIHLNVLHRSTRKELEPRVLEATLDDATVNTDEWRAYNHLPDYGRTHKTVCHAPGDAPFVREWARDDDGDGIREVHCNTMEGIWTGLRNFLRPFRGVHKKHLDQYVAMFEWAHNAKIATVDALRMMLGTIIPSAP